MQLGKMIFLFLAVFALEGAAMAVNDDVEYYSDFSKSYRHPFGVAAKNKITKEEAEGLDVYAIVKRDKENRIVSFIKMFDGKCFFHFEYAYNENGSLASYKRIDCPDQESEGK